MATTLEPRGFREAAHLVALRLGAAAAEENVGKQVRPLAAGSARQPPEGYGQQPAGSGDDGR